MQETFLGFIPGQETEMSVCLHFVPGYFFTPGSDISLQFESSQIHRSLELEGSSSQQSCSWKHEWGMMENNVFESSVLQNLEEKQQSPLLASGSINGMGATREEVNLPCPAVYTEKEKQMKNEEHKNTFIFSTETKYCIKED